MQRRIWRGKREWFHVAGGTWAKSVSSIRAEGDEWFHGIGFRFVKYVAVFTRIFLTTKNTEDTKRSGEFVALFVICSLVVSSQLNGLGCSNEAYAGSIGGLVLMVFVLAFWIRGSFEQGTIKKGLRTAFRF